MSDFEKFKEQLPSKEKVLKFINKRKIVRKIIKVWNKFEIKTMKGCHDRYLECDVLLLPNVFEKNRNNSFKYYGLCPSHYSSTPALSWNAMLNIAKVELQFIPNTDMYIFFEKGARGGISYISKIW